MTKYGINSNNPTILYEVVGLLYELSIELTLYDLIYLSVLNDIKIHLYTHMEAKYHYHQKVSFYNFRDLSHKLLH